MGERNKRMGEEEGICKMKKMRKKEREGERE